VRLEAKGNSKNFGLRGETMNRVMIDSLDFSLKSALYNLKPAILLGAMLLAFCLPGEAQQTKKVPRIGALRGTPRGFHFNLNR
jgi:hypothetical protein